MNDMNDMNCRKDETAETSYKLSSLENDTKEFVTVFHQGRHGVHPVKISIKTPGPMSGYDPNYRFIRRKVC